MADPTIKAKLTLDTKGFQSGVQSAQKSTGAFKQVGTVMAGVFGGNLITAAAAKTKDFFVGAVQGAMNAEQANTRFRTTMQNLGFGAAVPQANAFLATMSRQAAVSKGELRPAFETMLRSTHSLTGAQSGLKTALDVSAGTGRPLSQVSQALARGFLGSTTALAKMGIATKDASGHALPMTKIMENLNKTFGGQAQKQAGTMAGQMKNAGLQFKEFQITIGQALMPVLKQLMDIFMQLLPVLKSVGDWIKQNPGLFKIFAAAIMAIVIAYKIWVIVQWALNSAILANPIFWIIIGVAAFVAILIVAYQKVGWFRDIINTLGTIFKAAFNIIVGVIQWFIQHWQLMLLLIGGPTGIVILLIIHYWDLLKTAAMIVVNFIIIIWHGLVAAFQWIAAMIGAYIRVYITIWNWLWAMARAIVAGVGAVWRGIVAAFQWVSAIVGSIIRAIAAVWNWLVAVARNIINGIRVVWSGLTGFFNAIRGGVAAALSGIANVMRIPLNIANSVVNGIKGAWNGLVGFFHGIFGAISGAVSRIGNAIKGPINAVIRGWNSISFTLPKITLGGGSFLGHDLPKLELGGQHFQFPHINPLQTGGFIKSEGLAYLHAAEVVVPAPQVAAMTHGGPVVHIEHATFAQEMDVDLFMQRVAWQAQRAGI